MRPKPLASPPGCGVSCLSWRSVALPVPYSRLPRPFDVEFITGSNETTRTRLVPVEFELGTLSSDEIERILDGLTKYSALEKLTGTSRDYQRAHFLALAHKELLVALRELTSQSSFDNIVKDEFDRIPSDVGKDAYVYVAAVGQLDLALRYEVLIRLLHLNYADLGTKVFKPTEGVLISTEELGSSRHNAGFRLATRHPIIASIIFSQAAPDDDAKVAVLNGLLTQLDTGFSEDWQLLREITRGKELINTIASAEKRRGIYDVLAVCMPDDPYVLRHRSILERELGAADKAVEYARQAVKLDKDNAASLNTMGLALELEARNTEDPLRYHALINEANSLFEDSIRRDPGDAFGYLGKVYVQRQKIDRESSSDRRALLQADTLSLLEEAYEATGESEVIAAQLATQRKLLGSPAEAINILQAALDRAPANTRLRDLWIRYAIDAGNLQGALNIAQAGAKVDPTSWRLQRHIARLLRCQGGAIESIIGHYEAALRHHKGDLNLRVELGAFLFMNGRYSQAKSVFSEARDLPVSTYLKRQILERWKDEFGSEAVFSGRVKAIFGASGYVMAIPGNFEAFFWRSDANLELRENDPVQFKIGFNAFGALARILPSSREESR